MNEEELLASKKIQGGMVTMDDNSRSARLLAMAAQLFAKLGLYCDVIDIRWVRQAGFRLRVVDPQSKDPGSFDISLYLESNEDNRDAPELRLGSKKIPLKKGVSLSAVKELKNGESFWSALRSKAA